MRGLAGTSGVPGLGLGLPVFDTQVCIRASPPYFGQSRYKHSLEVRTLKSVVLDKWLVLNTSMFADIAAQLAQWGLHNLAGLLPCCCPTVGCCRAQQRPEDAPKHAQPARCTSRGGCCEGCCGDRQPAGSGGAGQSTVATVTHLIIPFCIVPLCCCCLLVAKGSSEAQCRKFSSL